MAGPKGYHSYHGRAAKGKIVLAVVLVAIILAALSFLALQRYLVYDESGRPYLDLGPWQEGDAPPEPPEDLDITIQKTEKTPATARGLLLGDAPLADWAAAQELLGAPSARYDAVALTMKDPAGAVYFHGESALPGSVRTEPGTAAALAGLMEGGFHTIARLSCFLDSRAARANVETMGLKNTGGYIFYDGNNENWLDPGKPAAREYLCGLARELAEMGFDEILLTNVSYPTVGKLDKIDYGETMKSQNLTVFLEEMKAALEDYDVTLSVELPETVVATGSDNMAGLLLADFASRTDQIYAAAAPDQTESLSAAVKAVGSATFLPVLSAEADAGALEHYLRLAA